MSRSGILGFEKFVRLEDWQKIQDSCSEAFGIMLGTYDIDGNPVSKKSHSLRLSELIPVGIPGYEKYGDLCFVQKGFKPTEDDISRSKCPGNLDVFFFPIKTFGQNVVAFMSVGPVILNKREGMTFYSTHASKMGISLESMLDALIEVNVFSHSSIYDIVNFIESVFSYIARTGYHKRRLAEIAQEVVEIDPLFSSFYEQKILDSLLNSCVIVLNADSGSVMTVDKKDHLHIAASSRMDKDIVKNTDIKVGEGIAGVAAATSKSIVLPADSNKAGVSKNMKRDHIKSSMIVPFNKANSSEVYGVLSLNIMRKDREFSDKDIALTKELVNLASIALTSVG